MEHFELQSPFRCPQATQGGAAKRSPVALWEHVATLHLAACVETEPSGVLGIWGGKGLALPFSNPPLLS